MELQKLRQFYTVAKYQHMTRAAEALYIAQPSLTQAITSLERELGVELFVKCGRNIFLTAYGKYLQAKLDGVFSQLDAIPTELELLKNILAKLQ